MPPDEKRFGHNGAIAELQKQQKLTVLLVQSINKRVIKLEKKPADDDGLSATEVKQIMDLLEKLSTIADPVSKSKTKGGDLK